MKTPDCATKSPVKDKQEKNSIQHAQARFVTVIAPPANHITTTTTHLVSIGTLAVRRSTVWSLRAGSPWSVGISAHVAVDALWRFVGVRVTGAHHLGILWTASVAVLAFAGELGDGKRELLLQHEDSLLNDGVRFKVANALHIHVEDVGLSIVVKRQVGVVGLLPGGILRDRPDKSSSQQETRHTSICEEILDETYHSLIGSCSYQ